jgi:cytochrome b pre-mRNA-processing protein 3
MLSRLFGRPKSGSRAVLDALYGEIVAAARQPAFYADWQVPDTPLGRFEMVSLHVFLVLRRLRGGTSPLAQELTDEFFKDVDHSIRELGVGDMGVPKRMKKLARMFYGRVASYDAALDAGDLDALAAALQRNVMPTVEHWPHAAQMAAYVVSADNWLKALPDGELEAGRARLSAFAPVSEHAA